MTIRLQALRPLRLALVAAALCVATTAPRTAGAEALPGPLADLQTRLAAAANHAPGRVGIAVEDLATGYVSGVNASASLPAASTIKIPVMIEVFRQMQNGAIDLNTTLHVEPTDRDWGWGDLADARTGTVKSVKQLLWLMITDSDNTATNMLIRLVGRAHVNQTMAELGLRHTRLGDYIRTSTDEVRYALRTSPRDMVELLDGIVRDKMIDAWSSRQMLDILTGQLHNTLLPVPLPSSVRIAHKTGSLHDTLNDVGIVFRAHEPYVIAVMTTQLDDLGTGRRFIHRVSRMAYDEIGRFLTWREEEGLPDFSPAGAIVEAPPDHRQPLAPDLQMWDAPAPSEPAMDPDSRPDPDGEATAAPNAAP